MFGADSTQVVAQPTQTFSAQYIQNMSVVDQYKSLLSQIRLQRINLIAQIQSLMSDIQNMNSAHQSMMDQFSINALQMFPQYQGQDLKQVISSLSQDNPLVQMWLNYSQNLNDVRNAINSKAGQLSDLSDQELSLEDQETKTIASYDDFTKQVTTTVPATADIVAGLASVATIPVADEKSVVASVPAIEDLSEQAAAMVTLQVATNQDPSAPVVDLSVAQQPQTIAPASAVASSPVAAPAPSIMTAISNLHPAIKYGGGALILMALFGKK